MTLKAIIDEVGNMSWKNSRGELHREDGPALINTSGTKFWFLCGVRHRIDGPAIEWSDKTSDWYYHGEFLGISEAGFWKLWERLSEDERQNINLHKWILGDLIV